MKAKDFFRYAAKPLNIFVPVCILIFIIIFFEIFAANIFSLFNQQNKLSVEEFTKSHFTVFSPPIFHTLNKVIENIPIDLENYFPDDKEGLVKGYVEMIKTFYPHKLVICLGISFIMMLITVWHGWARKNNRVSLVLWAILVGFFNLAGLLTYLAMNHTPTIKCSACGKKRNLERPDCIRCGANLPAAKALVIAD
jgi:hypothetical protein